MAKPTEAITYLANPAKFPPAAVTVVFGDEAFLRRQVLGDLKLAVVGDQDGEFSTATFAGPVAELRDVNDELSTGALFGGGKRLVVVEDADDFVSRYRSDLEAYAAHPRKNAVLVLVPTTWAATTRLYKALAESGLQIECKTPSEAKLLKWLVDWAKRRHQATLEPAAAEALMENVESDLGLFDQELAKLAALAGNAPITAEMVHEAVGGWRARSTWDMLDAAAAGNAADALGQLDHLLVGGEIPIVILAQIASTLRRFAAAVRVIEDGEAQNRRLGGRTALDQAGFKPFVLAKAEAQLRQLGLRRAGQFHQWLLEADLALKGESSSPARARFVLEKLIARMSRQAAALSSSR